MDVSLLHNLPNDEKLKVVFELWDDLASSNAPIQVSEGAVKEAKRRHEELLANPDVAIDDEEMWRRVDG
ncbi:MAG: addiction module protein [Pirellulales bacterium]